MKQDLLPDIEKFLSDTGLSAYRFGFLAVSNGRLVERLRGGGRVWPETEQAARDFMREYAKGRASKAKAS